MMTTLEGEPLSHYSNNLGLIQSFSTSSFEYVYEAPADPGYHWYHPHHPEAVFSAEVTRYTDQEANYYHYVSSYDHSNNNTQCECNSLIKKIKTFLKRP